MQALSSLDKVAYVRFASVYSNFRETKDFENLIGETGGRRHRKGLAAISIEPSSPHASRACACRTRAGLSCAQSRRRLRDRIAGRDASSAAAGRRRAGGRMRKPQALGPGGRAARGATAYVTLEPCAHHGETPPCAEALGRGGRRARRRGRRRPRSARERQRLCHAARSGHRRRRRYLRQGGGGTECAASSSISISAAPRSR